MTIEWIIYRYVSSLWNQYKYIAFNIFLVQNFDNFVSNANDYRNI